MLLAGRLAGRPTRANFRTGELTVCTMVPMRSVPHRVVALLGLDDGVFPRGGSVDGDDVLQRDPCLGERDVRSEDRQLLLDAVMSRRRPPAAALHRRRPGHRRARPPAVPLGEVLDVVRATVGDASLDGVLTAPPAAAVRRRATSTRPQPFSFDHGRARRRRAPPLRPRTPLPPLLDRAAAGRAGGDVALADLVAFLVHPVKALLDQRLGVHVPDREEAVADALQADLDSLAEVGRRRPHARRAARAASTPADFRAGRAAARHAAARAARACGCSTTCEPAVEPLARGGAAGARRRAARASTSRSTSATGAG